METIRNKLFVEIIPWFAVVAGIEYLFDLVYSSNIYVSVVLRSLQFITYIFIYLGAVEKHIREDNRFRILIILSFVFASLFSLSTYFTINRYLYYWFGGLFEYLILLSLFIERKDKKHMEPLIVAVVFSVFYAIVTYFVKGRISVGFAFYMGYIFFMVHIVNSIFIYHVKEIEVNGSK